MAGKLQAVTPPSGKRSSSPQRPDLEVPERNRPAGGIPSAKSKSAEHVSDAVVIDAIEVDVPQTDAQRVDGVVDAIEVDDAITERVPARSEGEPTVLDAIPVESPFEIMPAFPNPFRHPLRSIAWVFNLVVGVGSLIVLLVLLAGIPIVNLLVLGYLLEASGQVARTGKLRRALPILPAVTRIVTIAFFVWLFLWPVRFLALLTHEASLIEPQSERAQGLIAVLIVVSFFVSAHLILALARGGTFGCFLRPIKNIRWLVAQTQAGTYGKTVRESVQDFVDSLQLPRMFKQGALGFVGAALWLCVPTLLFATLQDMTNPLQWVLTVIGALALVPILCWVPFLQTRFAAEQRWKAFFELGAIRELFRHSPFTWMLATVVLFGFSLLIPAYNLFFRLLLPPHEDKWDIMLYFLISAYPARVFLGWAYNRATRKSRAWALWAWPQRLLLVVLVGIFVFILFFVPLVNEQGRSELFFHPAVLLPWPG